jgi:hypothetical protein
VDEGMKALRPCPSCRRHAREVDCPFCGTAIGPEIELQPMVFRYASRLAIATAVATTACSGGSTTSSGGPVDPCFDNGSCAAEYGAPYIPPEGGADADAGSDASSDAPTDGSDSG